MDLNLPLILATIVLLSCALLASLLSAYRKSKVLKKLTIIFEKYSQHTHSEEAIEVSFKGIPKKIVTPLDTLLQQFREGETTLVSSNNRLIASNRIFTHNIETFECLLDAVPDGILMIDLFGHVILLNRAMSTFLGASREDIIGKPIKECLDRPGWANFPGGFDKDISAEIKIEGSHLCQKLQVSLKSIVKDQEHVGKILFVKNATEQVVSGR